MPKHIFYSWQTDTPTATGKNLVGRALRDAIEALNADADVQDADREDDDVAVLDHDTAGVPGSPPIVQAIFDKIDRAAAFVSDLTYVAERKDNKRRSPNPNVLFEHGWAWKSLTWRAVISVMNIAHGDPRQHPLPFDLQHSKGPIFYDCPDEATLDQRRAARAGLAKALVPRLRDILDDKVLAAARVPPPPAEPHPHDLGLMRRWRSSIDDDLRRFLREHSFGEAYPRKRVSALHDINETWQGAQFEFDDAELQTPFKRFLKANRALCELLTERTHVVERNTNLAWVKTDRDREIGWQPSSLEVVKRLNTLSTALSEAIDQFDRAARARMRHEHVASTQGQNAAEAQRDQAMEKLGELVTDRARGGVPRIVSRPYFSLRIVPYAALSGRRLDPAAVEKAQLGLLPDLNASVERGSDARQCWTCALPTRTAGLNPETTWLARCQRHWNIAQKWRCKIPHFAIFRNLRLLAGTSSFGRSSPALGFDDDGPDWFG